VLGATIAGAGGPGILQVVDYQIRAWCSCDLGATVARFSTSLSTRFGAAFPITDDEGVPLARACPCGRTNLVIEVAQVGVGAIEWLAGKDLSWAVVYLAAVRVGATHEDAKMAADAVRQPPGHRTVCS
jgi:hypothetical protein